MANKHRGTSKTIDFLVDKNRNFNNILQSYLNLADGGTVSGKLTTKTRNETFGTSVAATGSDKDDAAAITIDGGIIAVTAGDNTKGVILPVVSGLTIGDRVKIVNFANATLEVYPGASDRIYPAADNGGITVAAYGFLELIVYSADGWVGNEGVIAA